MGNLNRLGLHKGACAPTIPDNWNGVLLVGDHPSKADVQKLKTFSSNSGLEVRRNLARANIDYGKCAAVYAYNQYPEMGDVSKHWKKTKTQYKKGEAVEWKGKYYSEEFIEYRDSLQAVIQKVEPKWIICFGEAAMRCVLGETGIDDFRGSMEWWEDKIPVMCTYSPGRIFKAPELRMLTCWDLGRVTKHFEGGWPRIDWQIVSSPTFEQAKGKLDEILEWLDSGRKVRLGVDIETRRRFFIGVLGIAWSPTEAMVFPFITPDWKPYWEDEAEEFEIISRIKKVLEHRNVRTAGQNYHYDAQYLARHWGVRSHIWVDTMVAHHVLFSSEVKKGLHVISSIYNELHQYWKDESVGERKGDDDDKWEPTWDNWHNYQDYCGKDCCTTLEAARVLVEEAIDEPELKAAWKFQKAMWPHLLKCMLRGNRYDWEERKVQRKQCEEQIKVLENFMYSIVPEDVYPRKATPFFKSPTQLVELFYTVLAIPVVTKKNAKGGRSPTTDDAALDIIMKREPLVKPLCEALQMYRSLRVFYDNFLTANPDYDGMMRSGYKLPGTSTYRLASAGDVFDFGMNLQNLSKGD